MAILAIALVGGELFSAVGLSFGLGMAVFGSVAELLLGQKQKPPTFKSMTSSWGNTWPIVYNNFRIAGQCIQAGPISTHADKSKKGGNKYSQTFAMGVCEGVRSIGRIWADNQTIYDPRTIVDPPAWQPNHLYATGEIVLPTSGGDWQFTATVNGQSGGTEPFWNESADQDTRDGDQLWIAGRYKRRTKVGKQYGFNMQIYTGTEDQMPDAALEEIVGTGLQPGYRGLVYVVFENFDLSRYGNRIPNFEFEIVADTSIPEFWVPLQLSGDAVGHAYDLWTSAPEGVIADWANEVSYQWIGYGRAGTDGTHNGYDVIFKTDMNTGECLSIADCRTCLPISGNYAIEARGYAETSSHIYLVTYQDTGTFFTDSMTQRLSKIDKATMTEVAVFTPDMSFGVGGDDFKLVTFTFNGANYAFMVQDGFGSPSSFQVIDLDTMTAVYTSSAGLDYTGFQASFNQFCVGTVTSTTAALYIFTTPDSGLIDTALIKVVWNSFLNTTTLTVVGEHNVIEFNPLFNQGLLHTNGVIFDPTDGNLIVAFTVQNVRPEGGFAKLNSSTGAIMWSADAWFVDYYANVLQLSDVSAGTLLCPFDPSTNDDRFQFGYVIIDTATGVETRFIDSVGQHMPDAGEQFAWNGPLNKLLYYSEGLEDATPTWTGGWAVWSPGQNGAMLTLADIATDVSTRVGISAGDQSFADLASVIPRGTALLQRDLARNWLESLMPAYFFDINDIGAQIAGSLRTNNTIVQTITEAELAASATPGTITDKIGSDRGYDLEIPQDMAVMFYDFDHDYQQGNIQSRRSRTTQYSSGRNQVTIPAVLNPGEAANIAERMLYLLWIERTPRKFQCAIDKVNLVPGDTVNLQRNSRNYTVRITKTTLQPTQVLEFESVSEDLGVYTIQAGNPTASVATGSFSSQTINPIVQPVLQIIDGPQLRVGDTAPGIYAAGCASEVGGGWNGEEILESSDNSTFTDTNVGISSQAVMGTTIGALGDCPRWTVWDRTNSLLVSLKNGALGNAAEADLLANLTNLAWLGTSAGGGEVLQFATADLVDATTKTYRISDFLRGRFGTETFIATHSDGDMLVMLDDGALQTVEYAASDIGATRYWKGQNDSDINPFSATATLVMVTRRLLPYSPCFLKASRAGGGALTITGLRRMRWRGRPLWSPPETDSPVTVEIDILNGAAVVRTLTSTLSGGGSGVTDPVGFTALYTAADQVADFGSTQSSVSIKAYSVGPIIGRGYGRAATL